MTKIVIIAGLSGAGKTTLLDIATRNSRYKTVKIGVIMTQRAIELGLAKDRDHIKRLNHKQVDMLRMYAHSKFSSMKGNLVLDTHTTIASDSKLEPALPFNFLKKLEKIKAFVYINALSREILARRAKDSKIRQRERRSLDDLDTQRIIDLSILGYLSTHLDVPLYIINNNEAKSANAAKELIKVLRESFGN